MKNCVFCAIVHKFQPAHIIYEDENVFIFLDRKPLFPGHCLLIPKIHYETMLDLPNSKLNLFYLKLQQITAVVKEGMAAQGVFVAANTIVSQSVAHMHFHVVPRNKGDGLRGFFWPRTQYQEKEMETVVRQLRQAWENFIPD